MHLIFLFFLVSMSETSLHRRGPSGDVCHTTIAPNLQNGDLFGIWSRLARPIVRLGLADEKESSLGTKKQGRTYIVRLQGQS